ncbi:MATE family efflux transporter [Photorhabdus sp. S12-55]|uniref:Photorhabdus luminescens subsp. laumondii TTO1 complete genome segment 3/17 n=3 Tax=Photorhabdus TaxID=29487 RepID=Q7N8G4_PHOLL|nr:MATE family efflux transporter [Photorhabdus sp. S7-51]RAW74851.1 MATE family efflux transporter [Photorhabdus sp. S14-60]RAW79082.1 MATE family efflux transporter [Photorhabdus sp. S15-56]RAW86494.1 MATE family efflux transporter [Photorhabdus sp. S5P8-50]RAW87379.1 MATE family efflux transporter [Photorhabdus sp. S12-55]CAE13056.1 unnamed protein product [Photorhabdus laumondii subsp. laumondii TTO1]
MNILNKLVIDMTMQSIFQRRHFQRYQWLKLLSDLWNTSITLWGTMVVSAVAVLINISIISHNSPNMLYVIGLFLPLNYMMMSIHEGLRVPALRYSSHLRSANFSLLGQRLLLLFLAMLALMAILIFNVWYFQSGISYLFHIESSQQDEVMNFIIPMLFIGIMIGFATLILSTLFGLGFNRCGSLLGISGTVLNIGATYLTEIYWHKGLQSLIWGAIFGSSYLISVGSILLYRQGVVISWLGMRDQVIQVIKDISTMALPVMGSFSLVFIFLFSFNYLVSFYDAHEIAGFSIAFRIQSFIILPAIALGTAMAIHYNNSLSKRNFVRANQVFLIGLSLTGVIYIFISVAVFFLKVWLVKFFTLDELIAEAALRYLNCVSPSYFSLGIVLGLMTALEQIGQGLRVLLINITLYSLEIGIAALLGLKQEDATRLYLTIAIFNWISALYIFSIFNKKSDFNIKYSSGDIHS